jgi:hypothetical protein
MEPRISSLAKRGSPSERRVVAAKWLTALLLFAAVRVAARPVVAGFTAGAADARSFQALRLTVDLGGRERQVRLALVLPSGARVTPELEGFTAGGRAHVHVLYVYIPFGAVAGLFTVRGNVIDGTQRWPFEAAIRVRANPKLLLIDEDSGPATLRGEEAVHRTWQIANRGNVLLHLRAAATPTTGAVLAVTPEYVTLAPGETDEITLTARLETAPDRLVTVPLFLNVESGKGVLQRRETVGFTAEFVPREAGTGPLFAEFSGEVLAGGVVAPDHRGMAGRIRLEGEVFPAVNFVAYGTDGTAAPGGSHLGLASRDFFTAELGGKTWRATGGWVAPPSFGFLENSTQGRGGTFAWSNGTGLTVTTLSAREAFGDFRREHAGLHAEQTDPDKAGWQAGVLVQRNQTGLMNEQKRFGGFAQTTWQWRQVTGSSQLAVAKDAETRTARLGVEQRLDYRTPDERTTAAGFVQAAPAGFFLGGRSGELRDAAMTRAVGESGNIHLHWSDSRAAGLLHSYRQTETEAGLTPTAPEFVELITRTGAAVNTWSAGYGFTVRESRTMLTLSSTARSRDRGAPPLADDVFRERAISGDWSKSVRDGRIFFMGTAATGTEENRTERAGFAEVAATMGGQVTDELQLSAEGRKTWHTGGAQNAGYRQPGTYGRGAVTWTPWPRWRGEAGIDAYRFGAATARVRTFLVVEVPVTARVVLATEISHDNERTGFWLAARVAFKARMPWRPTRGALTGRVLESGGRAAVPGVRFEIDGRAGLTDEGGRFTLPGRRPGHYPLTWSLPAAYLAQADWPRTVQLEAGKVREVDLTAERIALLHGLIEIRRGTEVERPTGAVSATEDQGQVFEAMAGAGEFKLLLPPGRYTVRFTEKIAAAVAAQLVAVVVIGTAGETVELRLAATETVRGWRRTFFSDEVTAPKSSDLR